MRAPLRGKEAKAIGRPRPRKEGNTDAAPRAAEIEAIKKVANGSAAEHRNGTHKNGKSHPVELRIDSPVWTLVDLDAALSSIGDAKQAELDALIDRLNAANVELALGAEEPPEDPRYKKIAARAAETGRGGDSSDPLALLFREAQRRPRPTRDEERRLFRRVVFARRRLERTMQHFSYPREAMDEFLRNAPCVMVRPSDHCANAGACANDDEAPCMRFTGLCGMQAVHSRCCAFHEARNAFVVRYLYLVLGMVRRYRDRGIDTADLVQEGSSALLRAVEDFEPERGFRFSTYARWWVNQAFLRTMYNNLRTVRLPVYLQKAASKVMRKAGDQDFREMDFHQLSKDSGVPESTIRILAEFSRSTVSLDHTTGDRDSVLAISDPRADFKPERMDRKNMKGEVARALQRLSDRERSILSMRFGLDAKFPRTLEEAGEELGLSRERVRQIQEEALAKLRTPLHLNRLRDLLDFD